MGFKKVVSAQGTDYQYCSGSSPSV